MNLTQAENIVYDSGITTQLVIGISPPQYRAPSAHLNSAFFVPAIFYGGPITGTFGWPLLCAVGLTCFRSATLVSPSAVDLEITEGTAMSKITIDQIDLINQNLSQAEAILELLIANGGSLERGFTINHTMITDLLCCISSLVENARKQTSGGCFNE